MDKQVHRLVNDACDEIADVDADDTRDQLKASSGIDVFREVH